MAWYLVKQTDNFIFNLNALVNEWKVEEKLRYSTFE
jgi:hypothetical protein